jgi:hypothetical protein
VREREGSGATFGNQAKLLTLELCGGTTMTFRETSNLRTFGKLVTMLQNTPDLLQNPVTPLFGKYPPKSNTKRFKNQEREREIDIIYIYVTL